MRRRPATPPPSVKAQLIDLAARLRRLAARIPPRRRALAEVLVVRALCDPLVDTAEPRLNRRSRTGATHVARKSAERRSVRPTI
jgi:hypothetical protein